MIRNSVGGAGEVRWLQGEGAALGQRHNPYSLSPPLARSVARCERQATHCHRAYLHKLTLLLSTLHICSVLARHTAPSLARPLSRLLNRLRGRGEASPHITPAHCHAVSTK